MLTTTNETIFYPPPPPAGSRAIVLPCFAVSLSAKQRISCPCSRIAGMFRRPAIPAPKTMAFISFPFDLNGGYYIIFILNACNSSRTSKFVIVRLIPPPLQRDSKTAHFVSSSSFKLSSTTANLGFSGRYFSSCAFVSRFHVSVKPIMPSLSILARNSRVLSSTKCTFR